jgi:hypothetical protein
MLCNGGASLDWFIGLQWGGADLPAIANTAEQRSELIGIAEGMIGRMSREDGP